ncbi:MAG: hypothetical protein IJB59_11455 [Oscillospiraceae bacterium]|nr:hypothetical protein [Oscillospiraceae bacterium]
MKRFTQLICLMLVCSFVLGIPAFAAEVQPYASNYFGSHSCYLSEVSSSTFKVCFEVVAVSTMDQLGTSVIIVQKSSDRVNWSDVKTYTKESYSQMTASNTVAHGSYVTFSEAEAGYYYRAYVKFYAKKGVNSAVYVDYTSYI